MNSISANNRFLLSALVGLSVFEIALAMGVPMWNNWFPPDATDVGFVSFLVTAALLRWRAS